MTGMKSELVAVRAELADLRRHFDERVTQRAALITEAVRLAPNVTFDAAASDDEIRARVVADAMGPAAIDGKCSAYIEARFDHIAEQKAIDPVRAVLAGGVNRSH